MVLSSFFFFQAEDGIRDTSVTGVRRVLFRSPWYGVFGPGTLSRELVTRLNVSVNKVLADAALRDQLAQQGLEVHAMDSARFAELLRADVARWGKIIRDLGIRAE